MTRHVSTEFAIEPLGYDAHSMKKIKGEHGLNDDSMIGYARENDMVLITKDTRCGRDCWAIDVPCILLDDAKIFRMCLSDLDKMKSDVQD